MYQSTEPLGLKALAAFVEEKGYSSYVYSGPVHEAVKLLNRSSSEKTVDAVGLYCDFETLSTVESFSSFIKENTSARVFAGGPQAVALDEDFMKRSRCDAVVRGEGEYPLYELLEFFLNGRGRIEDIAGASYFDDRGNFVKNPARPPISNLDLLPLRKSGIDGTARKNIKDISILTGRGCPFRCAFCYEGSVSSGVRLRSVGNSLSEIKQALDHNPEIKYIWFADDTFTLNPSRMEAFSKGLSKFRKDHDFVWFCECHPSAIIKWPDTLSMMIESGLARMQIGMESGSARILNLYKKQATLEDMEKVAGLSYKAGLPQLTGNMIIGGAAESKTSFNRTVSFAKRLIDIGPGMTDITSTFFIPLPKTAISNDPAMFDIKILDPGSITSIGDMAVIETKKLSREQIISMRRDFTRKILQKMIDVYKKGKIPVKRIIDEFKINKNYGLESNWYKVVFSQNSVINNFYKKLAAGDFVLTGGTPSGGLMGLYPRTVMDPIDLIDIKGDFPKIGASALSPLEYRILSLCDGGSPLAAVLDKVFAEYSDRYSSKTEFQRTALKLMRWFEEKLWIGYSEKPRGREQIVCHDPKCNDEARQIDIKPEFISIQGAGRVNARKLKKLQDEGVRRIILEMTPGTGTSEYRTALDDCLKIGIKIIAGRISPENFAGDIERILKTADIALALIDAYPGVFEAYVDDGCLRAGGFNNETERNEHIAAAQQINSNISSRMSRILSSRTVDFETILSHFKLHEEQNIDSIYYAGIFSPDPFIYNYFTIISRGAAQRSMEISAGELSSFRPQRIMAVWMAVNFDRGYPAVGNDVLSPLEYELLLHCTGKSMLGNIYDILHEKFFRCFENFDELKNTVNMMLLDFETKYWVLFSKI